MKDILQRRKCIKKLIAMSSESITEPRSPSPSFERKILAQQVASRRETLTDITCSSADCNALHRQPTTRDSKHAQVLLVSSRHTTDSKLRTAGRL